MAGQFPLTVNIMGFLKVTHLQMSIKLHLFINLIKNMDLLNQLNILYLQ